jgi:bla regulator protein BlaR1
MSRIPLTDSLGWTLLHFIWQGALIGLATALALVALRRARPEHRYVLACTGLVACLLWPAAELVLRLQGPAMMTEQMRYADAMLVSSVNGASGGLLALLQSQLALIVAFWAACAAVLALRMGLGLLWIRRTARSRRSDAHWQALTTRMAGAFGLTRAVQLRVVDGLGSPLTAGWLRPVILLPAALVSGMPAQLLEALLAHEMAHIRRRDYLVNLGQNVVEILLFYHPAVWWISGRIRVEREQIADDMAARHTGQPRELAKALSELERIQFGGRALAMAASGGDLLARVRRLLRPDTQALNWKAAVPVLALAMACVGVYVNAAARAPVMDELIVESRARIDFFSCARPVYPDADLAAGRTGTVTLGLHVEADGHISATRIARSSGHRSLDTAAREGLALCRAAPAMVKGQAVASWVPIQYAWVLPP